MRDYRLVHEQLHILEHDVIVGKKIDFPLTEDGANCVLARLVYLLRWYAFDNSETGRTALAELKKSLRKIRNAICTEIVKSEKDRELV